jgi:hypothetical protein
MCVSQNDTIPLDKFILHANKRKLHTSNRRGGTSRSASFSFFEAEYTEKTFVVVRLMAIFEISLELKTNPQRCGTYQLAVVCKMKAVKKDRECMIPEPFVKLKYGLDSKNCLDLDVIGFGSLHMPACVFDCCTNPITETSTNFVQCVFYQIPSSRMVMTKPVGSLEEMLALSCSDPMILPKDALNSELEQYKSLTEEDENKDEDSDSNFESDDSENSEGEDCCF